MKVSALAVFFLATPAAAFTEVSIGLDCKGGTMNKLTIQEKTFIAHALEETYNEVHGTIDNDDSELSNVHYGTWDGRSMVNSKEDEKLFQSGGYSGEWDCRLCINDDDSYSFLGFGNKKSAAKSAWEAKMNEKIAAYGSSSMNKLKSCSIDMKPKPVILNEDFQLEENVEASDMPGSKVVIDVKCSGVNFSRLSISEATKAGHILEDTYNNINDDAELSNVKYGGAVADGQLGQSGGYNGEADCRLCINDDDATMLSLGGVKMSKAWASEFEAGLAESGMEAFGKVGQCQIAIKPSPVIEDESNVDINVKCSGGPDFSRLTVAQTTFVSHALQTTYAAVHGKNPNDDSVLDHVTYHSAYASNSNELMQSGGGYSGEWDCRLCINDDDMSSMVTLGASGAALKAWENELVVALVESSIKDFQKIKSCEIDMKPRNTAMNALSLFEEKETLDAATLVNIAVDCDGIKFSKLSLADDTLVGHILEDTFNAVHDDSELHNVVYGASIVDGKLGQSGGYSGDWDCRLCINDDDFTSMLSVKGAAHTKWESEFVVGLVESGSTTFAKVKKCSIKMNAKAVTSEVVGEETKCGLRACAEV